MSFPEATALQLTRRQTTTAGAGGQLLQEELSRCLYTCETMFEETRNWGRG